MRRQMISESPKPPPAHSMHRLVRSWELASARYNRDCNMRRAEPGDVKRNKLREQAERAFQRMIEPIKRMYSPNSVIIQK